MSDMTLYGVPGSPFVRKVEIVMGEKSLNYELEIVNILPTPDWFNEISPARRIPVLRDRRIATEGVAGTLADSSAICAYLEKLQPEPSLYPSDAFAHGRAIWLEEYADSEMASTIGPGIFRPLLFPIMQKKEPDVQAAKKTWTEKVPSQLDYLESTLNGKSFFVDDQLSIADIAIACQLSQLGLLTQCSLDGRWPGLAKHLEGIKQLAGMQKNLAACNKIFGRMLPEKFDLG